MAHVRFAPRLIRGSERRGRHSESEHLRCLDIHCSVEFRWRLHRKVGWFFASQDAIDVVWAWRNSSVKSATYEIRPPSLANLAVTNIAGTFFRVDEEMIVA